MATLQAEADRQRPPVVEHGAYVPDWDAVVPLAESVMDEVGIAPRFRRQRVDGGEWTAT
jgi:hypothetical protein